MVLKQTKDLLAQVTEKVRSHLHSLSILARLDNNHLAILLRYHSVDKARRLAAELCQDFHYFPFLSQGNKYPVSISIGLAEINP